MAGTVVVGTRLTAAEVEALDRVRRSLSRAQFLRMLVQQATRETESHSGATGAQNRGTV